MKLMKLIKVVDDEQGSRRLSGNSCFPAPKKEDIGRVVIVTRPCLTWRGCLGYFENDIDKTKYAFWSDELEEIKVGGV